MASKITTIIANFETQLASTIGVGSTTGSLKTPLLDDDGVALPSAKYVMCVNLGNSKEEHLLFDLNASTGAMTNIKSVSKQGVETTGAVRQHRTGAKVVLTNFANLLYISKLLQGQVALDGANPLYYDTAPTFSNALQLATKGYIDGVAIAGSPDSSNSIKGIVFTQKSQGSKPTAKIVIVREQDTPNLTLYVESMRLYFLETNYVYAGGNSPTFTAPTTNNRYDLLVLDSSNTLQIRSGSEAPSPTVPSPTIGDCLLALILNKPGQTSIRNNSAVATGNDGYIAELYEPSVYRNDLAKSTEIIAKALGATGADGDLTISSGTTTVDLAGAKYVLKQYANISITGTGKLAFSNPATAGTVVVIKASGNVTLTSSTVPNIDLTGLGASASGVNANFILDDLTTHAGGAAPGNGTPGIAGVKILNKGLYIASDLALMNGMINLAPGSSGGKGADSSAYSGNGGGGAGSLNDGGAGGSSGGGGANGGLSAGGGGGSSSSWNGGGTGASGGRGGGALLLVCCGSLNFTGSIHAKGQNGSNAPTAYTGGGGGGAGGMVCVVYNASIALSGTIDTSGGNGGSSAGPGGTGGATSPESWKLLPLSNTLI